MGVLLDSGLFSDRVPDLIQEFQKPTKGTVVFDNDPQHLVEKCVSIFNQQRSLVTG